MAKFRTSKYKMEDILSGIKPGDVPEGLPSIEEAKQKMLAITRKYQNTPEFHRMVLRHASELSIITSFLIENARRIDTEKLFSDPEMGELVKELSLVAGLLLLIGRDDQAGTPPAVGQAKASEEDNPIRISSTPLSVEGYVNEEAEAKQMLTEIPDSERQQVMQELLGPLAGLIYIYEKSEGRMDTRAILGNIIGLAFCVGRRSGGKT